MMIEQVRYHWIMLRGDAGVSPHNFFLRDEGPEPLACIEDGVRGQLFQRLLGSITRDGALSYSVIIGTRQRFHLNTYRQRAWPFFDNERLYPGTDGLHHFPTMEDIVEQGRLVEQRFAYPEGQRERLRSQRWQDHFARRSPGNEFESWADDEVGLNPGTHDERILQRLFEDPVAGPPIAYWRRHFDTVTNQEFPRAR